MRCSTLVSSLMVFMLLLCAPAGVLAGDDEEAIALRRLAQAATSMPQAIAMAEDKTHGTATSCEARLDHGTLIYGIETVASGKPVEVVINADDGKLVAVEKGGILETLFGEESSGVAPDVSLSEAIDIAEHALAGRVVKAELEDEDSAPTYELKVRTPDGLSKLTIDAVSGGIVSRKNDDD